jgi:ParB-like chromosome segregation protein Spo0J
MTLSVNYKKTEDLIPYNNNSRTHDNIHIKQIASSIKEFGFTNPILIDENNITIAGHGRLMAAKSLNIDEVPTITLNDLNEEQRKAYVIADNKLALNAGWDMGILKDELQELSNMDYNLDVLGFDVDEIKLILDEVNFEPASQDEQGQLDELDPKWITCPHCTQKFDMREV